MQKRTFGERFSIPVIGQGTWQMPEKGDARRKAVEAIKEGVEQGMAHIDTAEMYGEAEEIIREAIKDFNRADLFVVSKVLPSNASYTGTIEALDKSLKRLGTDYLDCYLLHWRGNTPLSETLAAFEKLEEEGKIRSFGVSNFDVNDLNVALACLEKGKIACNQVLYNLKNRGIERSLIPFCHKHSISVVGYTPFGSMPSESSAAYKELAAIASRYDATPRQIILAFLTRLEDTFAIPKASRSNHVAENAGAGSIKLEQADIEAMDRLFPAPDRDTPLAVI
ncbi:MAG: aldo/keto reductase [Candidatus Melainabacteria bacterium]|nr:aldo/keto reductase [Candidatus Melainabacteria bacterium]